MNHRRTVKKVENAGEEVNIGGILAKGACDKLLIDLKCHCRITEAFSVDQRQSPRTCALFSFIVAKPKAARLYISLFTISATPYTPTPQFKEKNCQGCKNAGSRA